MQWGGCQQLWRRKSAFFLLNKKEALSGLNQVNDDDERNGGQAGRVYGCCSYRYLGVSNPGLQMLGSNECDVSYQYGTRASFQYIGRIPALYILRPMKLLGSWNIVSSVLSKNEGWMDECAARLQPWRINTKPLQHQTFAIEKLSDSK